MICKLIFDGDEIVLYLFYRRSAIARAKVAALLARAAKVTMTTYQKHLSRVDKRACEYSLFPTSKICINSLFLQQSVDSL